LGAQHPIRGAGIGTEATADTPDIVLLRHQRPRITVRTSQAGAFSFGTTMAAIIP
jgi:hypothetical protein